MKFLSLVVTLGMLTCGEAFGQGAGYKWFKGNTHTHTTMSDGDSTPGLVARWYRNNGYDFLFITDHNKRTEVEELQQEISQENKETRHKPFLLIPGEEVSNNFGEGKRRYAVHTAGLDTKTTVGEQQGASVRELLQNSIDSIIKAGGLPSVNHPNFLWSLTADDLFAMHSLKHYEIYNGHPSVNDLGGGDTSSTEEMWDDLLTRGKVFYGVAVDDAHHFKEFRKDLSNPGRGWVMVRARDLTTDEVMKALETGEFYSSTGVELNDLFTTTGKGLALKIKRTRNAKYSTEFIGAGGKILKRDRTLSPGYDLATEDKYVRARVTASNGDQAWTQPVYRSEPADEDPATTSPVAHNHSHLHPHPHPHDTAQAPTR